MMVLYYLIANAPKEPQKWWKPNLPPKPEFEHKAWHGDYNELKYHPDYLQYQRELNAHIEAVRVWESECEKLTLLQWPVAWAQEILNLVKEKKDGDNRCT